MVALTEVFHIRPWEIGLLSLDEFEVFAKIIDKRIDEQE